MFVIPSRIRLTLALCAGLLAAACGSDEPDFDPADGIVSMRITVGSQTVTVNEGGTVTGGPIVIGAGPTNVAVAFISTTGNPVSGLDEFEARITAANTALVTFARVSAFAGTLTKVAVGSTQLSIGLYHSGEQHFDFGPFTVPITIQ